MAVTALLYGAVINKLANEEIDLLSDTIKVALATASYTPDQDTHDYFDDVTNEVVGTGYTAGGATLANKTFGYTAGTNTWKFDADDTAWATSTITARYAIIYDSTPGTAGTNPLIALVDFGENLASSGAAFTITWNAAGIATFAVA